MLGFGEMDTLLGCGAEGASAAEEHAMSSCRAAEQTGKAASPDSESRYWNNTRRGICMQRIVNS